MNLSILFLVSLFRRHWIGPGFGVLWGNLLRKWWTLLGLCDCRWSNRDRDVWGWSARVRCWSLFFTGKSLWWPDSAFCSCDRCPPWWWSWSLRGTDIEAVWLIWPNRWSADCVSVPWWPQYRWLLLPDRYRLRCYYSFPQLSYNKYRLTPYNYILKREEQEIAFLCLFMKSKNEYFKAFISKRFWKKIYIWEGVALFLLRTIHMYDDERSRSGDWGNSLQIYLLM